MGKKEEEFIEAAEQGDIEKVKSFLKARQVDVNCIGDGRTALHRASCNGHIETVKYLVQSGAELDMQDKFGKTALHWASSYGHIETVKFVVQSGAQLDIQDKFGRTALHKAIYNGYIETVKFLVQSGAKLDIQDKDGWTALNNASLNGHIETVKFLVQSGAQLNIQRKDGRTALHWASYNGQLETVKCLVQSGAQLDIQDKYGLTAKDQACKGNSNKVHKEEIQCILSQPNIATQTSPNSPTSTQQTPSGQLASLTPTGPPMTLVNYEAQNTSPYNPNLMTTTNQDNRVSLLMIILSL